MPPPPLAYLAELLAVGELEDSSDHAANALPVPALDRALTGPFARGWQHGVEVCLCQGAKRRGLMLPASEWPESRQRCVLPIQPRSFRHWLARKASRCRRGDKPARSSAIEA